MVAKVAIDTNSGKSITEKSIDTDNDHVSSCGDINCLPYVTSYSISLFWSSCVNGIGLWKKEEMFGKQLKVGTFNLSSYSKLSNCS